MWKITIEEQLRTALIHSGLTQKEFCEKIGMSTSSLIQRMKNGKFTKAELEKMGKAMGAEYISYFKFPDGKTY
ncbi:MAG: helix-turn-helix domain-containing protein [Mediterraneibacter gnavus]